MHQRISAACVSSTAALTWLKCIASLRFVNTLWAIGAATILKTQLLCLYDALEKMADRDQGIHNYRLVDILMFTTFRSNTLPPLLYFIVLFDC